MCVSDIAPRFRTSSDGSVTAFPILMVKLLATMSHFWCFGAISKSSVSELYRCSLLAVIYIQTFSNYVWRFLDSSCQAVDVHLAWKSARIEFYMESDWGALDLIYGQWARTLNQTLVNSTCKASNKLEHTWSPALCQTLWCQHTCGAAHSPPAVKLNWRSSAYPWWETGWHVPAGRCSTGRAEGPAHSPWGCLRPRTLKALKPPLHQWPESLNPKYVRYVMV